MSDRPGIACNRGAGECSSQWSLGRRSAIRGSAGGIGPSPVLLLFVVFVLILLVELVAELVTGTVFVVAAIDVQRRYAHDKQLPDGHHAQLDDGAFDERVLD